MLRYYRRPKYRLKPEVVEMQVCSLQGCSEQQLLKITFGVL
uniref:Uncharacterized protein n=1 Tax=Anguilla anguilla TaxID=7936 RepID=A0A0E9PR31_ANGAN